MRITSGMELWNWINHDLNPTFDLVVLRRRSILRIDWVNQKGRSENPVNFKWLRMARCFKFQVSWLKIDLSFFCKRLPWWPQWRTEAIILGFRRINWRCLIDSRRTIEESRRGIKENYWRKRRGQHIFKAINNLNVRIWRWFLKRKNDALMRYRRNCRLNKCYLEMRRETRIQHSWYGRDNSSWRTCL